MKKILVCTGYYYPHVGGHERYVEEIYSRLPATQYQVHVFTIRTGDEPAEAAHRNVFVHRVDGWNGLSGTFPVPKPNRLFWKTIAQLRAEKFDLINTHTRFFPMAAVGTWLAKSWQIPRFHTEHGTVHPRGHWVVRLMAWVYDHIIGWIVIRSATAVVGISQASADFSRHLGARQISVIPNGVDTDFFVPVSREPSTVTQLTFVGRLIPAKGLTVLFSALSAIPDNRWILDIIGSGTAEPQLRRLTASQSNIRFHGSLEPKDIRDVLQRTDIFINPSYAEGLPTSVLEAGSCGCAVLATAVGGTAEIFSDAGRTQLLQPGDVNALRSRLLELIDDPDQRRRLGKENRRAIEQKYSWPAIAEQFHEWLTDQFATKNLAKPPTA